MWAEKILPQFTQFAYTDETTRILMNNAVTPKPRRFDEEWAKLDLAPMVIRGKADLQEASLVLMKIKPELMVSGNNKLEVCYHPSSAKKSR